MLIDNALSPRLATALATAGTAAIHVADLGLASASDEVVLATAYDQGRVLVSRDSDFAQMLAQSRARLPSVLLLRSQIHDRPAEQAPVLLAAIREHASALLGGAVVVVLDSYTRVHRLPLR